MIALLTTLGGKERSVAQDLCDCLYGNGDTQVRCEPIYPGVLFVEFQRRETLELCLSMKYFRVLVRRIEIYEKVVRSTEAPPGAKKVGDYIFLGRYI